MLSPYQRSRLLLSLGMIISLVIFWVAGWMFEVPLLPREAGSLIIQPSPFFSLLLTGVLLLVCVFLSSAIAGTIQHDAGLMCATFGLSALSMRGGPMRETLFAAGSAAIFPKLAIELVMLFGVVLLGWLIIRPLENLGLVMREMPVRLDDDAPEPLDQRMLATLTQAVAMSMLMMILSQSDQKAQALASVGICSLLGALAAHQFVPTHPSIWFWIGPLLVGLVGYLGTYLNPTGWNVGEIRGFFAPLARPQPLDYASVGPAGAILGYWISRRWYRARRVIRSDDAMTQNSS